MRRKPIIGLIYDFDGTLSPGNMQEFGFIQAVGQTPEEFWTKSNNIATADTKVEVNGYADKATGSAKVNQALSEKRAKAVVDLLKKAGMPESNIECKANGGVDLFNTPAYKNRVVTIEIK